MCSRTRSSPSARTAGYVLTKGLRCRVLGFRNQGSGYLIANLAKDRAGDTPKFTDLYLTSIMSSLKMVSAQLTRLQKKSLLLRRMAPLGTLTQMQPRWGCIHGKDLVGVNEAPPLWSIKVCIVAGEGHSRPQSGARSHGASLPNHMNVCERERNIVLPAMVHSHPIPFIPSHPPSQHPRLQTVASSADRPVDRPTTYTHTAHTCTYLGAAVGAARAALALNLKRRTPNPLNLEN